MGFGDEHFDEQQRLERRAKLEQMIRMAAVVTILGRMTPETIARMDEFDMEVIASGNLTTDMKRLYGGAFTPHEVWKGLTRQERDDTPETTMAYLASGRVPGDMLEAHMTKMDNTGPRVAPPPARHRRPGPPGSDQ